ncbi:MAG TPA: efflux RND transporter periplasmic adaptor subunit [Burkholderiales bacterium]|nr:efflux RND transporter periplasmic adaptor subunit [Burkholderiales bacterium]
MKTKHLVVSVLTIVFLGFSGVGLYRLGLNQGQEQAIGGSISHDGDAPSNAGDVDSKTGKKVLYWHDPMVPSQKFDQPGKSPFMDMQLVPVYEGGAGEGSGVQIDPRVQQNLGIRTAEVTRDSMIPNVQVTGEIAYNEREQSIVQARASGFVERVHVRATLDRVRAGQALVDLYVPEWVAAQEEYLAVRRMQGKDLGPIVDAAQQRMRQVGMSEAVIRHVAASGTVQPRITLVAPRSGVVDEIAVREGMSALPGQTLFRINSLETVWAIAEIPESQAVLVRPGATVRAETPALPGQAFKGQVQALLPQVNATTRTLRARVELKNPDAALAPGMFVRIALGAASREVLTVPTESLIVTGERTVVMAALEGGGYQPVEVEVGTEVGGRTEIKRGLQVGDRVVVSGQFLIDSEASLRGTAARMLNDTQRKPAPASDVRHKSVGKVEALSPNAITLSHEAVASVQWPAMTMEFGLKADTSTVKVGDRVQFEFVMPSDGVPTVVAIKPAGGGAR